MFNETNYPGIGDTNYPIVGSAEPSADGKTRNENSIGSLERKLLEQKPPRILTPAEIQAIKDQKIRSAQIIADKEQSKVQFKVEDYLPADAIAIFQEYGFKEGQELGDTVQSVAVFLANLKKDGKDYAIKVEKNSPQKVTITHVRTIDGVSTKIIHSWEVVNNALRYSILTPPRHTYEVSISKWLAVLRGLKSS